MENLKKKYNLKYLSKEYIDYLTEQNEKEGKKGIALKNKLIKANKEIEGFINQRHIKDLQININWKKSTTWGCNPHAEATGHYIDGEFFRDEQDFTCSGCGYDKGSTVIAEICNKYIRYKLYKINKKKAQNKPYGINFYDFENYFEGGIGTTCYFDIIKFLGGKFILVFSNKNTDCYKIEFRR